MALPIMLFAGALAATHYYEAYRILMVTIQNSPKHLLLRTYERLQMVMAGLPVAKQPLIAGCRNWKNLQDSEQLLLMKN